MGSRELQNLAERGSLKVEPPSDSEIRGLIESAEARLRDAEREDLSLGSRFDLAYNAAHALALAALRHHGYRSEKRYLVFQALPHTLQLESEQWRVLAKAHDQRNAVAYEGFVDVDEQVVEAVVRISHEMLERVKKLTR